MTINLAMSILVRDEIDIIRENILFHLNQGIDQFIVTDNGSVDGTREALEDLKRICNLHIIDESEHTIDQDIWVTRMATWLRENTATDWVINNDSDEFWWSPNLSLAEAIQAELDQNENSELGVLYCNRFNYLPSQKNAASPGYRFYDNTIKVVNDLCPGQLTDRDNILITRQGQKVITRLQGLEKIAMGNHNAEHAAQGKTIEGISIAHYPLRNFIQFEKKVKNHGSSIAKNCRFGPGINWHLRYWYEQHQIGQLRNEYDKYVLDSTMVRDLLASRVIEHDAELKNYFVNSIEPILQTV